KRDQDAHYTLPYELSENQWGFVGRWKVTGQQAALVATPGKLVYRFHARDLHLVLGPGPDGAPVPFIVRLDGQVPGNNHGSDIDSAGNGTVQGQRLYQLIRQQDSHPIQDRTFEVEFLKPGVWAYAFTFG